MSSADDVFDMRELCAEIASREAQTGSAKEQIGVVSKALGVGWNRALELLKGKARRVDAWEKDNARQRVAELRRREAVSHVANLNRTLQYLRTTDPDGYRTHLDRVERALAGAGVLDSAVAEASRDTDNDF